MSDDEPDHYKRPSADLDDIQTTLQEIESTLQSPLATLDDIQTTLQEIKSNLPPRSTSSGVGPLDLIWVAVVIVLLSGWSGSKLDRFTDRMWYSVADDTNWSNVHIDRRPSDCDFLYAPIGTKKCRYEKDTVVFGDKERRALIAAATTPEDRMEASKRPNSVVVYWGKKDEPAADSAK
jgi:hypothetical protein